MHDFSFAGSTSHPIYAAIAAIFVFFLFHNILRSLTDDIYYQ